MSIAMVDYGMGNRRSVVKAFEHVGSQLVSTADHAELRAADGLVVPGVGAFPEAMRRLRALGLDDVVRERATAGVPVIGLCLGMQLLFERADEHEGAEGIGLLAGRVVALDTRGLKSPHIGWNSVAWQRSSPLIEGLADPAAFYHVHSFVAEPEDPAIVLGIGEYGVPFVSFVAQGNVFGAQCHPEKSSTEGLALLRNFVSICAPVHAAHVGAPAHTLGGNRS